MNLSEKDRVATIERYRSQYQQFGYSPKALGWDKGKQEIRFGILIDFFDCKNKSILDIGCGFGDLNKTLTTLYGNEYSYVGIDLVTDLLDEGRERYQGEHIRFIEGDFLTLDLAQKFDIVISSGIFNHQFNETDHYPFIEAVIAKAYSIANEGITFDFLSDKVDYRHPHTLHSSPERILAMAYKFSRNIMLRNDYFPFEFSVCLMKDNSFSIDDTIFNQWKQKQKA